jgi:hypothetical protein
MDLVFINYLIFLEDNKKDKHKDKKAKQKT